MNKTRKRSDDLKYGSFRLENLPEGYVIDDRYEILRKLGQGGFGAVYLAHDQQMDIDKALKILPEAFSHDEEAMTDLQSEAKTMVTLNHPNIVRVYDLHLNGEIKYIDMEYIDGKTLTGLKLEYPDKRMPEEKVREIAIQISEGIAYAHKKGIIHKDIKPQNVMDDGDGQIKIMDFGIAETVRVSMSRIDNTSSSGTLVYMSPEQIRGKDVGKESDIYSFGAMLYELLSGHPPFYKGAIEHQIINEEPDNIENISYEMDYLIMKCLSKNYADRYTDFEEVQFELKNYSFDNEQPENKENIVQAEDEDEIDNSIERKISHSHESGSTTNEINQEIENSDESDEFTEESQQALKKKKKTTSGANNFVVFVLFVAMIFVVIVVGLNMEHTNAINAERDALLQDINNIASAAAAYWRKPAALGGGARSFLGVSVVTSFGADRTNANGRYIMSAVRANSFILTATGSNRGVIIITTLTQNGVSGTPTIRLP